MLTSLTDILTIIGALAFFIFGMKVMSEGIQRAAGHQLRKYLSTMTKNRFRGVVTGFVTTGLIQSSSATTVMTVSFVNAGLITVLESAGVMMGAKIGTTVTAWIISILGFQVKLSTLSIPLFAIAVPMIFSNRARLKSWGEFIAGFAILFLALSFLREAVPNFDENPELLSFVQKYVDHGILSVLLFVVIGAIVAVIIQSSSAAMTLTMVMCVKGWIPFELAAAMVLGENIGTTLTAEIASLVGNDQARKSARIHTLFNVVGVLWAIIMLPVLISIVEWVITVLFNTTTPTTDISITPLGLSVFHSAFNIINVLFLLGLVPWLVQLAARTVGSKEEADEDVKLSFIGTSIKTPELSILEVKKEIAKFEKITHRMLGYFVTLMNAVSGKERKKMIKKLQKYELITDRIEDDVNQYISKLSELKLSPKLSIEIREILNISFELENISDIIYQMTDIIQRKLEQKLWFNQDQRNTFNQMIALVDTGFLDVRACLENNNDSTMKIQDQRDIAFAIKELRNENREPNEIINNDEYYNLQSVLIFNNLCSSLEKIAGHLENIHRTLQRKVIP